MGDSIKVVNAIDSKWTKERIRDIKNNVENAHGYVFEVVVIAMLARAGMNVRPTKKNQAGIDAIITYEDGFEVRLSFKSFDVSAHEQFFLTESKATRKYVIQAFSSKIPAVMTVLTIGQYLGKPEWEKVRKYIAKNPRITSGVSFQEIIPGRATISFSHLAPHDGCGPFSSSHLSDTFLAISSHHKNEQVGFEDKVKKAAANMTNYADAADNSANVVLVRLPPSAPLTAIRALCGKIIEQPHNKSKLDAIVLYQLSATRNSAGTSITHYLHVVGGKQFIQGGHGMRFCATMGIIANTKPRKELHSSNGKIFDIDDKYVYQAGDHFNVMRQTDQGMHGNLSSFASGIKMHAVMPLGSRSLEVTGKFPPSEDLVIL
ncbi:MAG: hypothetical protein ACYCOU_10380 [Sulfobacillus sp.]